MNISTLLRTTYSTDNNISNIKTPSMKKHSILLLLYFSFINIGIYAQENKLTPNKYKISLISSIINETKAPLWQTSNKHGIIPEEDALIAELEAYNTFHSKNNIFKAHIGADIITSTSKTENKLFPSQLYLGLQYHKLLINIGIKHEITRYNGLSSTNGEIQWSNNARSMPGYNITFTDFFSLNNIGNLFRKGTKRSSDSKILFNFEFGDYIANDNRYCGDRTLMHKDFFAVKILASPKTEITCKLNRIIYWAGKSERLGTQPNGFRNYLRVIFQQNGGSDANISDQINKLGNTLGAYNINIKHTFNNDKKLTFYYSHPFEDRSGMRFQNGTDGVWGIYFENKKSHKSYAISHLIYEYINTTNQSGKAGSSFSAGDNYFNNGIYSSGHTFHKRTIGLPLMYPKTSKKGEICMGIQNNTLIAHHIGLDGLVSEIPYTFLFTISNNKGLNYNPYKIEAKNYSCLLQFNIAQKLHFLDSMFNMALIQKHKLNFILGATYSKNKENFLPTNTWGAFLKLSFNFITI